MSFDPTKPVQTRYGNPVRIFCTDYNGRTYRPILAAWKDTNGQEHLVRYSALGEHPDRSLPELDLINVPEKKTLYCITYQPKDSYIRVASWTNPKDRENFLCKYIDKDSVLLEQFEREVTLPS